MRGADPTGGAATERSVGDEAAAVVATDEQGGGIGLRGWRIRLRGGGSKASAGGQRGCDRKPDFLEVGKIIVDAVLAGQQRKRVNPGVGPGEYFMEQGCLRQSVGAGRHVVERVMAGGIGGGDEGISEGMAAAESLEGEGDPADSAVVTVLNAVVIAVVEDGAADAGRGSSGGGGGEQTEGIAVGVYIISDDGGSGDAPELCVLPTCHGIRIVQGGHGTAIVNKAVGAAGVVYVIPDDGAAGDAEEVVGYKDIGGIIQGAVAAGEAVVNEAVGKVEEVEVASDNGVAGDGVGLG